MIFEHYHHKVFNKILLSENFGKALCRKRRLVVWLRILICVHKNLSLIVGKIWASFHAKDGWYHLFTLECFNQKKRIPCISLVLLLQSFTAGDRLLILGTSAFLPKSRPLHHCMSSGWDRRAVIWIIQHPPFHSICLAQKNLLLTPLQMPSRSPRLQPNHLRQFSDHYWNWSWHFNHLS